MTKVKTLLTWAVMIAIFVVVSNMAFADAIA